MRARNFIPPDLAASVSGSARKLPVRRDSQERLDRIIEVAILLLEDHEVADISMSMIATSGGITRTSIYAFFPTVIALYEEVARRYVLHAHHSVIAGIRQREPKGLFELLDSCIEFAAEYFNSCTAARKTLLGAGVLEIHIIDREFDVLSARVYREFHSPEWPVEPYSEADPYRNLALLQNALYAASVQRHGRIEPFFVEQAKIMSKSYMTAVLASMGVTI